MTFARLYHPRPERWPQFTLRGLMIVTTLACILAAWVLPGAVAAFQEWMRPKPDFDALIELIQSTITPTTGWDEPDGDSPPQIDP